MHRDNEHTTQHTGLDGQPSGLVAYPKCKVFVIPGELFLEKCEGRESITSPNDNNRVIHSQYYGIALGYSPQGLPCLELVTRYGQRRALMESVDAHDIIAQWRALAKKYGLALLVMDAEGKPQSIEPKIGHVMLGTPVARGPNASLRYRRPRFLRRRKVGIAHGSKKWAPVFG